MTLEFRNGFPKWSYQTLAKLRMIINAPNHSVPRGELGAWIFQLEEAQLVTIKDGWMTATEYALRSYAAQIA